MQAQETEVLISIPGNPQGKGRARSVLRGFTTTATGKKRPVIGHYTPEKTRTWEGVARTMAIDAMRGREPLSCPVRLMLDVTHAVPESWPGWKRELALAGAIEPTVKPDLDNVEKAVKDACNGVVWVDDCQVTVGMKAKRYGAHAGVKVRITPRLAHPAQIKRRPGVG